MNQPGEARFDDTERNLWRALEQYDSTLCPGCGQPHTRSLYDKTRDHQPIYVAGFVECLGCKELLDQKETQRLKDAKVQHAMQQPHKNHPHNAPQLVTGHRHYRVWEQPVPGHETPPPPTI